MTFVMYFIDFFSKVSTFCLVRITSRGTSADTCKSEEGCWKMWLNVTLIKLKYYIIHYIFCEPFCLSHAK